MRAFDRRGAVRLTRDMRSFGIELPLFGSSIGMAQRRLTAEEEAYEKLFR